MNIISKALVKSCKKIKHIQEIKSMHYFLKGLEEKLNNTYQAVQQRRKWLEETIIQPKTLKKIPIEYDYDKIYKKNCENVIGVIPVPVGIVGPLNVNKNILYIPLATTEGALIASISRGCNVINKSGGSTSIILKDKMSRGPAFKVKNIKKGKEAIEWIDKEFINIQKIFNSTSNHCKLLNIIPYLTGRTLFLRIEASTGNAMGMNMLTKGTQAISNYLCDNLSLELLTLSGNICVDKKASFMNWIHGRGKYVISECIISHDIINNILHTTPKKMEQVHINKNYIGSSIAGTVGGNNAHAANIIAAFFLSTGQDIAQVVESSHCITQIEVLDDNSLYCSVTLPCIELGTIGGGTTLDPQKSCIDMILQQYNHDHHDSMSDSQKLACVLASTVLAGEINLIAALSSNHLLSAHMNLNRKVTSDTTTF